MSFFRKHSFRKTINIDIDDRTRANVVLEYN